MLSYPEAPAIFAGLRRVIVDEIHALAESKRGDQLALGLARLETLAPGCAGSGCRRRSRIPPALAGFLGAGRGSAGRPGARARDCDTRNNRAAALGRADGALCGAAR